MYSKYINTIIELDPSIKIISGVIIMVMFLLVRKVVIKVKRRCRKAKYLAKKSIRKFIIAAIFGI